MSWVHTKGVMQETCFSEGFLEGFSRVFYIERFLEVLLEGALRVPLKGFLAGVVRRGP